MTHSSISIAGRRIARDEPPYVIGEISANHLGSLERAKEMIRLAAAAGLEAVKLQTYTPDAMTIDGDGPGFKIDSGQWAGRTLYDLYEEAMTPPEWHGELFETARSAGITIFSSPFDEAALALLESLDAPAYKIASFEIVDLPLIAAAAATHKPLIISTGMASIEEAQEAVKTARTAGAREIVVLHCVSGYPTPVEESNLLAITQLEQALSTPIGLSDHSMSNVVPAAAVALGAVMIEKHFTIKRADGGPDASFSLEAQELPELVAACRDAWSSLGAGIEGRQDSEQAIAAYRRSLYVVRDIAAGEAFTKENVRSIRPGSGLAPKHLNEVLGRKARVVLPRGTPLSWDVVGD